MPERHRILIVDDNASDRQALIRALSHEAAGADGIEADILEADSVALAREALGGEEFACIFLAHDLPDGTALDLLMEVRSRGLATPVVVLTGQRDEQTITEVMRAGAVDYLPKERLHPDLVARSLRAALRFLGVQREKQTVLEELRARDRAIAAASNGIVLADPRLPDCPIVYTNESFLRMTGYSEDEVVGRNCRFLQGPDTDPDTIRELREAVRAERSCQVATLNYRRDGTPFWNEVTVSPVWDGQGKLTHFVGIQTDVTARHEAEDERRSTAEWLRQFKFLSDNANDALFLLDEAGHFVYVNEAASHSLGYSAAEFQQMRPSDIDPAYDESEYRALFERADGERLPPFESVQRRADGTPLPIEANVSRLNVGGRFLLLSSCRDITERKKAEAGLAAAYRREALLNQIGQAVRQALPAGEIEQMALAALAESLGADRCLSITIDRPNDLVRFGSEWRRPDLPPLAGDYRLSEFAVELKELFPAGGTLVVADTQTASWSPQTASVMTGMRIRALMDVPLTQGDEVVGVLGAYMADEPRRWTDEEVSLVEAVASQLRAATEAARLRQREHNIAVQLQAALQPDLPGAVPGLAVRKHYEAALIEEAGVGGDFYDVFATEKGRTALVVGDLSGKGLQAAAQVSTCRNMLRAFLYTKPSVAAAVEDLNRVLVENNLLSGFATLWVGTYDGGTRTLNYVNCGQEPALLRRAATGMVEQLAPTGPILGMSEGAQYVEATVRLSAGDALAVFSDGMTEVGLSRREMLGVEGVADLFARPFSAPLGQAAEGLAEVLIRDLVAGVDAAAQGGVMRDDVCLLVAVAA